MNGSTHEEILKEDQGKKNRYLSTFIKFQNLNHSFQKDKNQKFEKVKGEDWNKRSFCKREPELMEVQQRWCLSPRCITVHAAGLRADVV